MKPLIVLSQVTKTYATRGGGEAVTPLEKLDLVIGEGEFVALMGPSGSGKSTLLHLIAGIDTPTHGTVRIGEVDVGSLGARSLARWRNRNIGFVFQQYNLVPVLTAAENVELPLLLTDLSKAERAHKVDVALDVVGLGDRAHHLPRQLSGGQQQRVAIARAVVAGPAILLADEPTGNLDEKSCTAVLGLLKALHARFRQTLVMVTHDPRAAEVAERVVHLDKGRIHDPTELRPAVEEVAS